MVTGSSASRYGTRSSNQAKGILCQACIASVIEGRVNDARVDVLPMGNSG